MISEKICGLFTYVFLTCFKEALKLGLTSFGGPVAHLAYFREAYVERLKWLSDEKFAELLALCQFIPGPASSQLGAAIGYEKGGWRGAFGAWAGFTLPSVILIILFVTTLSVLSSWALSGAIQGLTLVAAALFVFQSPSLQPALIILGGLLGAGLFRQESSESSLTPKQKSKHRLPL